MKLHLPKNLFCAVMALYVSHAALTTAWAEGTQQPETFTYTIEKDVTYGYNGTEWTGIKPTYSTAIPAAQTFTSSEEQKKQCSVAFDGTEGAIQNTAIAATEITIENLKEIKFTGFADDSSSIYSKGLTIQNNGTVSIAENTGNASIQSGIITIENNDAVSLVGNSVISGEFDADGNAVSNGSQIRGGVIYGSNAMYGEDLLAVNNNGEVNISGNSLLSAGHSVRGGAIFARGPVNLEDNGDVSFVGNTVESRLGVIDDSYSDYRPYADAYGGAICIEYHNYYGGSEPLGLSISNNTGEVKFQQNSVIATDSALGGAIYDDGGEEAVISDNAGGLVFSENKTKSTEDGYVGGGAIYTEVKMTITGNDGILFDKNTISTIGGTAMGSAILAAEDVNLVIEGNTGSITVSNNGTETHGIYYGQYIEDGEVCYKQYYGGDAATGAVVSMASLSISNNVGNITFSGNYINELVGTEDNPFEFEGRNERLVTESDFAGVAGGAAIVGIMEVNICGNKESNIEFSSNTVTSGSKYVFGGAVANLIGGISIADNEGTIEFNKNSVTTSAAGVIACGGAVAVIADLAQALGATNEEVESIVKITGNKGVSFSGNTASAQNGEAKGGAIYSSHDVILSGNKGEVTFSGNRAAGVKASGGAIYASRGLSIANNEGDVTFKGNYVKNGDFYKLNSIHVESGKVELAAADGASMTFHDSIYVGAGEEDVKLNSYTDAEGNTQTFESNIIFSGATTEADLKTAKNGVAGTTEEITASRTSVIERNVSIATGSLQVKDEAVLKVNNLSVEDAAKLLVGGGSRIEAENIVFDSNTLFTVGNASESLEKHVTFSVREAAPVAELQADTVMLMGGMTYKQDGAYTMLLGDNNTLTLDVSNGLAFTLVLDDSVAYTEGEMTYFVLFTGAETLDGITDVSEINFTHNLSASYSDAALGYDKATGTLYVGAKSSSSIPEPTTATLSLLALAALAARRRRR